MPSGLLKGLPNVKFINTGPDAPEGGMNDKAWTLYFSTQFKLLQGIGLSLFGHIFPLNIVIDGLPARNYANDAAAAAGGVPIGGLYHNAGAVRVRLV